MRFTMLLVWAAALFVVSGPVLAASQSDAEQCKDVSNAAKADQNIAACNRIINDPKEPARNRAISFSNRCGLWQTKREVDRALSDCNQAIRFDPKYPLAYNNRGVAYKSKGDHDRAIADYSEAIRLDPKFVLAYENRGDVYRAKGDNDRAFTDPKPADLPSQCSFERLMG